MYRAQINRQYLDLKKQPTPRDHRTFVMMMGEVDYKTERAVVVMTMTIVFIVSKATLKCASGNKIIDW